MKNIMGLILGLGLSIAASSSLAADICNSQSDINRMSFMTNEDFKAFQKNDQRIDQILVSKKFRRIYLLQDQKLIRSYPVAFGNPNGPKRFQGDNKTPEGTYFISRKNPHSQFFMALEVSYPNMKDVAYARAHGKSAGGDIMIHGLPTNPALHRKFAYQHPIDWTRGCVAVNDTQIREIYSVTDVKTPITICPK